VIVASRPIVSKGRNGNCSHVIMGMKLGFATIQAKLADSNIDDN